MRIVRVNDAVIAIHSTRRGPAYGGIRRWRYATHADAEADARRLAVAMSLKCALAELPAGGAKCAIRDRDGLDPRATYEAVGRAIDALGGEYWCGPDVGTGEPELSWVRGATRWVNPPANDAAASTARGVIAALGGVARVLGAPIGELSYVVQGLGAVGSRVARDLAATGAEVLGCDVRDVSIAGVRAIDVGAALSTRCDVLVPCALGGILDRAAAERVPLRAICGPANNQLADDEAGEALARRGVLFAPDAVASAGAVIEGVLTTQPAGAVDVGAAIDRIGERVESILRESIRERRSPMEIARERGRRAGIEA